MKTDFKVTDIIIETERIYLREFYQSDLNDFYEYAKVEGVGEAAGWPHHENIQESQRILNKFLTEQRDFAICYKENDKVIGSFGIWDCENSNSTNSKQKCGEIGYVLSKDYWNRGLMTEITKKVIEYLFSKKIFDILFCSCFEDNSKSRNVIQKCGFTFDKHEIKLDQFNCDRVLELYKLENDNN
ncbi:MAG: GNAT family N-acetyltransferase [Bacilli bacterium]